MKNNILILVALLNLPNLAMAKDEPSLLLEGSLSSLIALKENFTIEYSDQVSDGCLPQPSRMKDKMEIVLRQNGFSISQEESLFPNRIKIIALGFATSTSSCAVHLDAELVFWGSVVVPYAQTVPSGPNTFAPITFQIGSIILTGNKNGMQERIEKQVKEFGEILYLSISRAKDDVKEKFPQILDYKAKLDAEKIIK
ncbi:hypothetical protein [Ferrimonas balearica]|uniref:hypothetical protein n=1 Tax=Ferrimonas balearica TaxID=44012 RepID=UPI001C976811|nr:hypothetical protein [Ferrimonas balearica]MBY5980039.1 hypothetical protein [Ferrimonas balearica]